MTEPFRPALHFTPAAGWMNDPNGMVLVHDTYHLFFQHDPGSIFHGPMHWGHATSTDLVHWSEQPVALRPDALGTCFSGSAVQDQHGAVKLFYTAHRLDADGRDYQTQCLVHADLSSGQFVRDPANPVLGNPGQEVFRDPKVIWHEGTSRWIMAITLGQSIGFYSSVDMVSWTFESAFGEGHGRHGDGVWECPDLICMPDPDGHPVWVLIVSVSLDAYGRGSGTQYFLGEFDGRHFVNANAARTELWLDHGRDFYAAQTFFGHGQAPPVVMAWASNWTYARHTPTTAFRGAMTLPRQLGLVRTTAGLRLAHSVPDPVRQAFSAAGPQSGVYHRRLDIDLSLGRSVEICLFGESEPHFLCVQGESGIVQIETRRGFVEGMTEFEHTYTVPVPFIGTRLALDLYVDRGLVELIAADGLVSVTNLFFPNDVEGGLKVTGSATVQYSCSEAG